MNETASHFLKKAIDYYEAGQYDDALNACDNAIHLEPSLARAYHGRGLILSRQQKYQLALEDYQKSLELNPDNAKLHADMGKLLYILGSYEQSGQSFRKAIELNKKYRYIYDVKIQELLDKAFALRKTYWKSGTYASKSPATAFKEVLLFDPDNEKAKYYVPTTSNQYNVSYSYSGGLQPYRSKSQIEQDAIYNNQWALSSSIHPANCRCHLCWEP